MRRALVILLCLVLPSTASILNISTINQAFIYCTGSGSGCAAPYGTAVPDLTNAGNWTLHVRIKRNYSTIPGNFWPILVNATWNGNYICAQPMLFWKDTAANVQVEASVGFHSSGFGGVEVLQSSFNFNNSINQWHDITLVHTAAHVWTFYIDGVQDSQTTATPTMDTGGCDVVVGSVDGQSNCGAGGSGPSTKACFIMDVSQWSAALPTTDILALASCASRPNQISANPDYWLPLDGGYAPFAHPNIADLSGNSHNAGASSLQHFDYPDSPLFATNSSCSPDTGEATH